MAVNSVNDNSAAAAAVCSEAENKPGGAEVYFQRGQNPCHLTHAHMHTQFCPHSADVLIPGENVQTQISSCALSCSDELGRRSIKSVYLLHCVTFLAVLIDRFAKQRGRQPLWLCLCLFKCVFSIEYQCVFKLR